MHARRWTLALLLLTACSGGDAPSAPHTSSATARRTNARTAAPRPSLTALADGCLCSAYASDLEGLWEGLQRTPYGELGVDLEQLLARVGSQYTAMFAPAAPGGSAGAPSWTQIERVLRAFRGEAFLGLLEFRLESRLPDLELFGAVRLDGAGDPAAKLLAQCVRRFGEDATTLVTESSGVWRVQPRSQPMPFEIGVADDVLWFGFGEGVVQRGIAKLAAATAPASAPPRGRDAAAQLRIDLAALLGRAQKTIPPLWRGVLQGLGIDRLGAVTITTRFDSDQVVVDSLVASPGCADLLGRYLSTHPVSHEMLARIPPSATAFTLFTLDLPWLCRELRERLPAQVVADVEQHLGGRSREFEHAILPLVGPQCAVVTLPGTEPPTELAAVGDLLDTAFLVRVAEPKKLKALLGLLQHLGGRLECVVRPIRGVDVTTLSLPATAGQELSGLSPSLAVAGGCLVATLRRETMSNLLADGRRDSIGDLERNLAEVPKGAACVSFDSLRGPSMVATLGKRVADRVPEQAAQAVRDFLPRFQRRVRQAQPALSYWLAEESGIRVVGHSPTGSLPGARGLVAASVVAAIAIPNLMSARQRANEVAAIATLRMLCSAQAQAQAAGIKDRNGNGSGEYAFVGEMVRPPVGDPLLPAAMAPGSDGTVRRHGYLFRVYLPGSDGEPVGEHRAMLARIDATGAETTWLAMAWPQQAGKTGKRSFFVNQSGEVWETDQGNYSGATAGPPPDLLLSKPGKMYSDPLPEGARTRDGTRWRRVR
ncbi:MAG: DUF2950 family protein [Planctomycetes bacterium]|nr:DUF2950 family protein [Planctomycetota bacterium]MCB9869254.1 DUF2950 family protein [Planctomycetota bacterium]MCB9889347.1 DUF2950 family protein [Planctomycetota bacterium]